MTLKQTGRGVTWASRKAEILEFIKRYHSENGISPAMWEIAEAIYHTRNAGNIGMLLDQLQAEGFIYRRSGMYRSIVLTVPQPRAKYLEE